MGKEEVVHEIEDAIKECKEGSWNFPTIARAFLVGLLYLVEHSPLQKS